MFYEAFQTSYLLVADLRNTSRQGVYRYMFIYRKQMFDVITYGKQHRVQRLDINIMIVGEVRNQPNRPAMGQTQSG